MPNDAAYCPFCGAPAEKTATAGAPADNVRRGAVGMILTFALAIAAGVGGAFAYSRVAGTAHAVPRNVAHHPHAKPRGGSQRAPGGVPKKTT